MYKVILKGNDRKREKWGLSLKIFRNCPGSNLKNSILNNIEYAQDNPWDVVFNAT